ncbi:MAG TPA: GxxExxY protein [Phycisphaerae bacterium]|nr:GxxExxY protein [Phycisphaerae bacterium]
MEKMFEPIPEETERIASQVVDAAIKVHRVLGPGLLESVYEQCLAHELTLRGFRVQRQLPVPVVYEGLQLEVGYRLDLLVNDRVIVECKAVKEVTPVDRQQTLTHIKLSNKRLGFLINFNVTRLKDGLTRIIN